MAMVSIWVHKDLYAFPPFLVLVLASLPSVISGMTFILRTRSCHQVCCRWSSTFLASAVHTNTCCGGHFSPGSTTPSTLFTHSVETPSIPSVDEVIQGVLQFSWWPRYDFSPVVGCQAMEEMLCVVSMGWSHGIKACTSCDRRFSALSAFRSLLSVFEVKCCKVILNYVLWLVRFWLFFRSLLTNFF